MRHYAKNHDIDSNSGNSRMALKKIDNDSDITLVYIQHPRSSLLKNPVAAHAKVSSCCTRVGCDKTKLLAKRAGVRKSIVGIRTLGTISHTHLVITDYLSISRIEQQYGPFAFYYVCFISTKFDSYEEYFTRLHETFLCLWIFRENEIIKHEITIFVNSKNVVTNFWPQCIVHVVSKKRQFI